LTAVLNSLIMAGVISWTSTPRTVDRAFCRLPRWSMAMAAMTPRSLASAFMRFILPADNSTGVIMARARREGGPFRAAPCLAELEIRFPATGFVIMKTLQKMIVSANTVRFDSIALDNGTTLGPIEVAYETYGELNAARTNAIMVLHAFSGDA